jgi:lipoate---protein ligase
MPRNIVIHNTNNNLFHNLAFEEYAMDNLTVEYNILFLWQSACSIVIGKHQNPFREFYVDSVLKNNIQLGRRISGGGTVYHDLGNLNFSFIAGKESFNKENNFSIIIGTLNKWKVYSHISSNNDIMVFDKKISGNAFCHKIKSSMHHGTLLVESDLARLKSLLKKPEYEIIDNSVISKRSIIDNLKSFNEDINIYSLKKEIINEYDKNCGTFYDIDLIDENVFSEYRRKTESNEWIFGFPEYFTVINKFKKIPVDANTISIGRGNENLTARIHSLPFNNKVSNDLLALP